MLVTITSHQNNSLVILRAYTLHISRDSDVCSKVYIRYGTDTMGIRCICS